MRHRMRIEFYRTRELDGAQALLGRVTHPANDLAEAIEIARSLLLCLEMPQRPDGVAISDTRGRELYRSSISRRAADGFSADELHFHPDRRPS